MQKTNPFQRFNTWISIPVLLLVILALGIGIYLEPLMGNLTRMGGHSENAFGWTTVQQKIQDADVQYEPATGSFDLLILGDSFSNKKNTQTDPGTYWHNYLWAMTGLRTAVYNRNTVDPRTVIQDYLSRPTPPKIIIYQMLLSDLNEVMEFGNKQCDAPTYIHPTAYTAQIQKTVLRDIHRPKTSASTFIQFHQAISVMKHRVLDIVSNDNPALKNQLNSGTYFSNRDSHLLLTHNADLVMNKWRRPYVDKGICGLRQLQTLMQENESTFGVILLVPNKTLAYAKSIKNTRFSVKNWYPLIAESEGIHAPRLDLSIEKALKNGLVDLYLPDDTHWGFAGHRLAAEVVRDFLVERGVLKYPENDRAAWAESGIPVSTSAQRHNPVTAPPPTLQPPPRTAP